MTTQTLPRATFDDLMKVEGKAELVDGRIVQEMPGGFYPSEVASNVWASLKAYTVAGGRGRAVSDPTGYALDPQLSSGRQSLCPEASFYTGPLPKRHMGFIDGAPVFAVEVRSDSDYGSTPDREYAAKRADYFEAGTLIVWDVDPVAETVASYSATNPLAPRVFRRGDTADAEPAVPGWRLAVDAIFT